MRGFGGVRSHEDNVPIAETSVEVPTRELPAPWQTGTSTRDTIKHTAGCADQILMPDDAFSETSHPPKGGSTHADGTGC